MKTAPLLKSGPESPSELPSAKWRVPRWKRCLDIALILISAPAWAVLMVAIALLIKLVSRGPVLFRQERLGLSGVPFSCLKFRTMHAGAPTAYHEKHLIQLMQSDRPMQKLDDKDPRLIPIASLLRATGLDELPQLFNVLRGEMSLVGPRPCTVQEYAAYTSAQRARLHVLPGLTGLWQVSGKNRTTFQQMIELDLRYARLSCLWLDIEILRRTPLVLSQQILETLHRRRAKEIPPTTRRTRIAHDRRTNKSAGKNRSNEYLNN
jgi:exopolysaccharide production protein ExoY